MERSISTVTVTLNFTIVPPNPGTDLGWRTISYDLSAYKGQYIRLVFSNRNLWPESWGIWSYVDDVRVLDAGLLPGPWRTYLPHVTTSRSDAALTQVTAPPILRPPTPTIP